MKSRRDNQIFSLFQGLLFIVGVWTGFCVFVPCLSFAELESDDPEITVLVLNVWAGLYEMNFERLARQIAEVKKLGDGGPDVICLQEVFDERAKAMYANAFPEYDVVSFNAPAPPNIVVRSFTGIAHSLDYAHRYVGRFPYAAGAKAMFQGDAYGLMILLKRGADRAMVPNTHVVKAYANPGSDSFSTAGIVDALKPRAYQAVQYQVRGERILIVNTHWSNGVKNPKRLGLAHEVVEAIQSMQVVGVDELMPAILAMDSNAHHDEPEMHVLNKIAVDTFATVNPNIDATPHQGRTWSPDNTNTINGGLVEPPQRMDYIFVVKGSNFFLHTLTSQIVLDEAPFPSDHFGVFSKVKQIPQPCELKLI